MSLDLLTRLDPLRRILCPFCFERFAALELHVRCTSSQCRTDFALMIDDPILTRSMHGAQAAARGGAAMRSPWWIDPRRDPRRGAWRHLDWMLLPGSMECPNCHKEATSYLCPRCHATLPEAVITLNAGHIAIFGPQSVGKTTFVTVLIHELDHRVGPSRGFVLDPLTDEVRDRYRREYHEMTYGGGGFGVGDLNQDGLRRGHSATPSLETDRGVLRPLVYRFTRRGKKLSRRFSTLLSFFDTAGEDWEMNIELLRSEARYLGQARGLLFLLDPLRIPEVAHDPRLTLTEKERLVPPADYLNDARKLATFFRKTPVKVPLAIVLNKLDRWGKLLDEGTMLHEFATTVQADEPDRGVDAMVHEEVRSALRRWGMSGFLEHVEQHFPQHRFFAVSALGDAAPDRDDAPQPLPTPILVDRPVVWLLEKQGILD